MPKHRPRSRQHLIAALFGAAILLGVNPAALAEEAETPAKPSFIERASAGAHEMAMNALSLLGVNYRYGGDSPDSGFDCSGMVRQRVNIPSYIVKSGDVIEVSKNSKDQLRIKSAIDSASNRTFPSWIEVNSKEMKGIFKEQPDRSELPATINESLVVELYSK